MKLKSIILVACLFIITSCSDEPIKPVEPYPSNMKITSGFANGFMPTYNHFEIQIQPNQMLYIVESTRSDNYPEKRLLSYISTSEWLEIEELVDMDVFLALDDSYRCVEDCVTDGGSSWIIIEDSDTTKRIGYEDTDSLSAIMPLLHKLRELRQQMDDKMFR